MIYLVDHEDSFTFNLAHLLGLYDDVFVSNYYQINESKLKKANTLVLSPGPGEPKDYTTTTKIYNKYKGNKKIIGICLGFQQILYAEGGFFGLANPFETVDPESIGEILEAHRIFYGSDLKNDEALRIIEETFGDSNAVRLFLDFIYNVDATRLEPSEITTVQNHANLLRDYPHFCG